MAGSIFLSPGGCCNCSGCQICVTVLDCNGAAVSGATVTVKQGATTIGTCTTNASGQCCVTVPASGTYNVAVTKTGYNGSNQNVSLTCPGTTNVTLYAYTGAGGVTIHVIGCDVSLGLQGATVTFNGGSYTTNSSGYTPTIAAPAGTYTWTASKTRFNTGTSSVTVTGPCSGNGAAITLTPATGYTCGPDGCQICGDAWPTSLTITTPVGTFTVSWVSGCIYQGCVYFSHTVDNCHGGTVAGSVPLLINYTPGGTGVVYQYLFTPLTYSGGTWTNCASGTYTCGGCTCFLATTAASSPTSETCPPGYSASGTMTGLTGLDAIFNGPWIVSE